MGFFREYRLVLAASLLLHLGLVAALVMVLPARPLVSPQRVAIQATVVDQSAARKLREQRERQRQEEEKRLQEEEQRRQAEAQRQQEEEQRQKAEEERQRQAEQERLRRAEAEKQRQEEEAARRKREAEEAERRKAEEEARRRRAEEERKRQAEEEARQRQEAERRRQQELQAQLQDELAAEEEFEAFASSGALDEYRDLIAQKVNRNWARPPSARPGISCEVTVRQIPGGEVVDVRIGRCNGDDAVRRSIEAAVYQASPLPEPSDPRLFERTLIFDFKPEE